MDAIKMIQEDHKKVKRLFKEFSKAKEPGKKKETAHTIFKELIIHSKLEEELFYPAMQQGKTQKIVLESFEEHHVVDLMINEMIGMDIDDDRFEAKFEVLRENVLHHIEEEEQELLPYAKKVLGKETLQALGLEMMQRKDALVSEINL